MNVDKVLNEPVDALKKSWPQEIIYANENGRIVGMGSLGYTDSRNLITDVIIGASHGAEAATQLAVAVRPRGIITHDACATIGMEQAGAAGLALLDRYLIAGAAVDGFSARMSDPVDMYESGKISFVNESARRLGIEPGMSTKAAASAMLNTNPPFEHCGRIQHLMHESADGKVFALDTVRYVDDRIEGSVLCMGSHSSPLMPRYLASYGVKLSGVITNDCGPGKDNIGICGLPDLDKASIPGATVGVTSARVGDARSTYLDGVISYVNETAKAVGIKPGQSASEAAALMLKARSLGQNN